MVFHQNVVAAIKCGGRVLREIDGCVMLPFGSEYSILIKNLHAVRVQVNVSIDGTDATGLIVLHPNTSLDLERFIKDGNWESGNRFKFIERTEEIEQHRESRIDDGIVRIEYQTELLREVPQPQPQPQPQRPPRFPQRIVHHHHHYPRPRMGAMSAALSARPSVGITAPGSVSRQRFVAAERFDTTGQSEVIVIRLIGSVDGHDVKEAVTINDKPRCVTCGQHGDINAEFCARCGSAMSWV